MNNSKYVIFKEAGWWHFQLQAANGQIMFTSHPYAKRRNAQHGIGTIAQLVKSNPWVTFKQ
jgi:uncharacterized protein YegP (UPF0339 family)